MSRGLGDVYKRQLVGLARKLGNTPTSSNTLVTLTLRHTNHVNKLILREQAVHIYRLLEEVVCKVNLSETEPPFT